MDRFNHNEATGTYVAVQEVQEFGHGTVDHSVPYKWCTRDSNRTLDLVSGQDTVHP